MTENHPRQVGELVGNVLKVRGDAISIAFDTCDASLYAAAIAGNDAGIATLLDQKIIEGKVKVDKARLEFYGQPSPFVSLEDIFGLAEAEAQFNRLIELRDLAKANARRIMHDETQSPMTLRSTEELLATYKVFKEEMTPA